MSDLDLGRKRAAELGLCLLAAGEGDAGYLADDIHRLLGEATEVGRYMVGSVKSGWGTSHLTGAEEKALLIGVKPVVQESDERKLLRELVAAEEFSKLNITYIPEDWANRAKRLLEEK